jgi:hypothetical protein
VYTEKKPGIQPGGDSSGYTNLGTALVGIHSVLGFFPANQSGYSESAQAQSGYAQSYVVLKKPEKIAVQEF